MFVYTRQKKPEKKPLTTPTVASPAAKKMMREQSISNLEGTGKGGRNQEFSLHFLKVMLLFIDQ